MAKKCSYFMFLQAMVDGRGAWEPKCALYGIPAKETAGKLLAMGTLNEIREKQAALEPGLHNAGLYSMEGWSIFIAENVPFDHWPDYIFDILGKNPHT